jgi:molybdate transport system substrate-binding protein
VRWSAVCLILFVACGSADSREVVVISAASSLIGVFGEIENAFEAENPSINLEFNFAGSSALREQVLNGAQVDVFASADQANVTEVLPSGTAVVFAENRLVVAYASGNPEAIAGVADLARGELFVGVCAEGVPCGNLAEAVFVDLGVTPDIDSFEPNVRSVVTKIVSGDLDVGLVYLTDVSGEFELEGVEIDSAAASTGYFVAVLSGSDAAAQFVGYLLGSDAQAVLQRAGFTSP